MSKKIYSVWFEWDLGQEGQFFSTKEKAVEWAKKLLKVQEMEVSFDDLRSDCLAGIDELRLD